MHDADAGLARLKRPLLPLATDLAQKAFARSALLAQNLSATVAVKTRGRGRDQNLRLHAQARQRARQQARPIHTTLKDAALLLFIPTPFADILAREVYSRVVSLQRLRVDFAALRVPMHSGRARRAKRLRVSAHQPRPLVPVREQRANQRAAHEAGRTRDDNFHEVVSLFDSLRQRLARDLAVVEVPFLGSDDLIVLVPLARDDDDVARTRLGDGAANGLAAVNNLQVRPTRRAQALLHIAQDGLRVFRAWVVRGRDDDIAQARRGLAHRRALRPVSVAAATEDRDDAPTRHITRRAQDVAQRVVRMRVIDDDGKVAPVRHALEATRRTAALRESRGRLF